MRWLLCACEGLWATGSVRLNLGVHQLEGVLLLPRRPQQATRRRGGAGRARPAGGRTRKTRDPVAAGARSDGSITARF